MDETIEDRGSAKKTIEDRLPDVEEVEDRRQQRQLADCIVSR